jgi:hypothetical protein
MNKQEEAVYSQLLHQLRMTGPPDLMSMDDFENMITKGYELVDPNNIEKAIDTSKLVKKTVLVSKNGKVHRQTFWVKPSEIKPEHKKESTPIGEELSPSVKGMDIRRYSEKAFIISGDTKENLELLRSVKKQTNVGRFIKQKGWMFPMSFLETVLGLLYSDQKLKGNDEKAEAIKNQKNELPHGTPVEVGGENGAIKEGTSDSDGAKYNVKMHDGTTLNNVNEKAIGAEPEKNDKKIAEIINNVTPEGRVKAEKQLYGISPVEDIHKYSLGEYLGMHGIPQEDVDKVIDSLMHPKKTGKKSSSGVGTKKSLDKNKVEGLTKRQIISKLIFKHYQAVKTAIANGEEIPKEALSLYSELKEAYSKKRQAMSEETKRKISEALKKNKTEEEDIKKQAQKAAQEIIDSMSKKDLNSLADSFKSAVSKTVHEEQAKLAKLVVKKEKLLKEKQAAYDKADEVGRENSTVFDEFNDLARLKGNEARELEPFITSQQNTVQALVNGGATLEVTDKVGTKHTNVSDFTNIDTGQIEYSIDTILTDKRPIYIPDIDEKKFENGGYTFDAIRVSEDKYMIAVNGYQEKTRTKKGYEYVEGPYDPSRGGFVTLSLDQLVLTQDYYITRKKAQLKQRQTEKNEYSIKNWDEKSDESKQRYMDQIGMYRIIGAKNKKKISEEEWNKLTWQEKEKIFKPVKTYGMEKLKKGFDSHHMAHTYHGMYERFVDPSAQRYKKIAGGEKLLKRGERSPGNSFANKAVWDDWVRFREMIGWKMNDIDIQREEMSGVRKKAIETSYGKSNTNDFLKKDFGVMVKRQNGSKILPNEIEQLSKAWQSVKKTFGPLKEMANRDDLVLSHAGQTYMFASKAIGVYYPSMKAIGVTAKFGENQLGFTMAHEVAHWIDDNVGSLTKKRHASDNFESTAGQIAIKFRASMNEKTDNKYLNATHEAFARAWEFHNAIQSQGASAIRSGKDKYTDSPAYISMEKYTNVIKPLIEKFLEENKEVLKSF